MTLEVSGRVGPVTALDGGVLQPLRQGKHGEVVTGFAHGAFHEAASRGSLYFAANQAGVASPAGLTASSLNFTLYNPAGSGVNLSLLLIQGMCTVDPAADAAWYLVGNLSQIQTAPATVTGLTVYNALLGGSAGKGLVYSTATLAAAPVVIRPLLGIGWGTAVGFGSLTCRDRVDGAIIIQPGIYVSVQASAVATGIWSMLWEEVAI